MLNKYRIALRVAYTLYLIIGIYGALWVSDDLDNERLQFYAFFAIPIGILLPYGMIFTPRYWKENPKLFRFTLTCLLLSHLWGITLLANAITDSRAVVYTHLMKSRAEQHSLRVAYRRGGLGWLYRLRW